MAETQKIWLDSRELQVVFNKYSETPRQELLTVLGGTKSHITWHIAPTQQTQTAWSVSFDSRIIWEAAHDLAEQWHATDSVSFTHNHNREYGHGFRFSKADLGTAENLYETDWIDRMGLVMNGEEVAGKVAVQHFVQANHKGELHNLHWSEWEGKVVTRYEDAQWIEIIEYHNSIVKAEKREAQIIALKKTLVGENPLEAKIVQMHPQATQYAQAA